MLYIILMHIHRFIFYFYFFTNDLLLAVYFKYTQTREMMLDKKQIQAIFLFKYKMGRKAVETTHNIYNTFGLGIANEHLVQWCFKKFFKGDKSLEDEEHGSWQWPIERIIQVDPFKTSWEVSQEHNINHSRVIQHLKQTAKVKKLDKWIPHKLNENFKKILF